MKATLEGDFNRMSNEDVLALVAKAGPHKSRTFMQTLALWTERARQRRQMRRDLNTIGFNDDVLADFGLSRKLAEKEANKHFWQA